MKHEFPHCPPMEPVALALIEAVPSMTQALQLCARLSGRETADFLGPDGVVNDPAQWSRVMGAGQHNFPQDKLNRFMNLAGNEAPLLWLLHSRGYDLRSIRHRETEMERRLRVAEERLAQSEQKNRVLVDALHGRVGA